MLNGSNPATALDVVQIVRDFGLTGICGFLLWAVVYKLPKDLSGAVDKLVAGLKENAQAIDRSRELSEARIIAEIKQRRWYKGDNL